MDIASFLVVFFCSWWMILFMVLPWGVERDTSGPEIAGPGAPKVPHLKKKFIITTAITIVVSGLIVIAVNADWFSFREVSNQMAEQDFR